jgi:hypothetical protein
LELSGPLLGLVRLADLQPAEECSPSRVRALSRQLNRDGYLANPLIVSRVGRRFLLLEGVHRLECLRAAGCSHALVDFVPLEDSRRMEIETWFHIASVHDVTQWLAEACVSGLELQAVAPATAEARVRSGRAAAWLCTFDASGCRAWSVASGAWEHASAQQSLAGLYRPVRLGAADLPCCAQRLEGVFAAYPQANLFVRFARIGRDRLVRHAQTGERIPAEILRIVVRRGRVLGANVPLELLTDWVDDSTRARWLARLEARQPESYRGSFIVRDAEGTRRYEEPLFVYDRGIRPSAA